jgi:hypothetical protein
MVAAVLAPALALLLPMAAAVPTALESKATSDHGILLCAALTAQPAWPRAAEPAPRAGRWHCGSHRAPHPGG